MKRLNFTLVMILLGVAAMAMPAKRVKKIITLADGTQVEAVLRGDEHVHFFQSQQGECFQEQEDGTFVRVDADEISQRWAKKLDARNTFLTSRRAQRKATWGAQTNPISGKKTGLVILVNFLSKKMSSKHTQAFYNRYFNEVGFSDEGMAGSVHDYFYECSYGKFDLSFDVVGPVTVSNDYSYYGKNDSDGNDKYPCTLVIEALKAADKMGVDFSKYDWDGDGQVDQVYLVFAGFGENQGAATNTIWPHEWELSAGKEYGDGTGAQKIDGVTIDTYAISCELAGTNGTTVDGIGTACHEFSHCMCIPDFYDTEGSNFGMSYWDVMDTGSYSGDDERGECPTAYTSYERMYCGWLTPTELSSYTEVSGMKDLTTAPEAYIIYNQANKKEFYMLENRQAKGFFASTMGHGMLVLHVDFNASAWTNNTVNNTKSRQRMTIIPADGSATCPTSTWTALSNAFAGDPFPGSKNKTELTNTSTPKATLYNANSDGQKLLNFPIRSIKETSGLISFTAGEKGTAIETPFQQALQQTPIYDLQGREVSTPQRPGLYIVGGKKVWVK